MESTKNNKILIVEDDLFLGKVYKMKLIKEGFEVVTETDGETVIERTKTEMPGIILLDIGLPNKDGFAILDELKTSEECAACKDIPVIILTKMGQDEDVKKGMEKGASDFLCKMNVSFNDVVEKIKKHIADSPVSPAVNEAQPTTQDKRTCADCGKEIPEDSNFCLGCGAKV